MGIRFNCPNGHKLNVKEFLAGKRGVCPQCGAKFIIPVPNGVPLAEVSQPVGVGPSRHAAGAIDSPSVIISVTDLELATPQLGVPPAIRGAQVPTADALPASIVAVQQPLVSPAPGVPSEVAIASQRERTRRNQMIISLLLLALVVVLAGVLVWVLQREGNQTPTEKTTALNHGTSNQGFAMARGALLTNAQSRIGAQKQWI